jgi:NADH-quinone oxidoreductase subunit A
VRLPAQRRHIPRQVRIRRSAGMRRNVAGKDRFFGGFERDRRPVRSLDLDPLTRRLCLSRGGPLSVPFHFANVLIFSALAVLFVLGSLLAGRFLRPHYPTAEKGMIYECGEKPIGQAWFNFNPRFYLIALVFVIFEVEIAFMFPVASVYKWFLDHGQGLLAFAEIFVFVAILAVGLAYVWAMGDLEWVKGLRQDVMKAAREKAEAARKAA